MFKLMKKVPVGVWLFTMLATVFIVVFTIAKLDENKQDSIFKSNILAVLEKNGMSKSEIKELEPTIDFLVENRDNLFTLAEIEYVNSINHIKYKIEQSLSQDEINKIDKINSYLFKNKE